MKCCTKSAITCAATSGDKGSRREAAQACKAWGFANLPVDRIISLIRPENLASRRVAGAQWDDAMERTCVARLAGIAFIR